MKFQGVCEGMNEQRGRRVRESALFGVTRRYGQSLSFADRVIVNFKATDRSDSRVSGMLFSHDATIPVVFDRDRVGRLDGLPAAGEAVKVKVSCRPWISRTGQLSFIVHAYEVLGEASSEDYPELSGAVFREIERGV
ncbi:hypothetical protein [Burkholderia sp. LMG 13014]|uniref:hypothetical protein n=1 Tax=Burkholderia sp. LMG 13014 TaxID=2709306 RepID=UPI00196353AE|nr:hypothetical protein [Burkholderia sp. LMG 13014]